MKLNLGCGRAVKKGYVNLDFVKLPGVDVVHDLDSFPYPFKANTFDEIYVDNVLEHLNDIVAVMAELHRISKKGAVIKIIVPYFHYHGAYQDPTHKHFFTLDTFDYFVKGSNYDYYTHTRFEILKKELIPTALGKLVPFKKKCLNMLAMVFGELAKSIYFELRVVK